MNKQSKSLTVEELIKELQQFNPKAIVNLHACARRGNGEREYIDHYNRGVVVSRDAASVSYGINPNYKTFEDDYWDKNIVEIHSLGLLE